MLGKPGPRGDDVAQVNVAMVAVVQMVEGLAVARRAAIVDRVDGIAMVDEMLDRGAVAAPALAAWAAMDIDDRRHRMGRTPPRADGRGCRARRARHRNGSGRRCRRPAAFSSIAGLSARVSRRAWPVARSATKMSAGEVSEATVKAIIELVAVEADAAEIALGHAAQHHRLARARVGDGQPGRARRR